jgi:putative glycosyltransferase (TIGR04372 family)
MIINKIKGLTLTYLRNLLYVALHFLALKRLPASYGQDSSTISQILESGVITNSRLDIENILFEVYQARLAQSHGRYFESIERLEQIYESVYRKYCLEKGFGLPKIFSSEWSAAFGHIGNLGIALRILESEISSERFTILAEERQTNYLLLQLFSTSHNLMVQSNTDEKWSTLPNFWPIIQQQDLMRLQNDDWIRPEVLFDDFFGQREVLGYSPLWKLFERSLDENTWIKFESLTTKLEWYVVIHVRDSGDDSIRNQKFESYIPAINHVIDSGGTVFRIGNTQRQSHFARQGYFDLTNRSPNEKELDSLLIENARFFVGTTSGPISIARMFSTPSLITNMTNIAPYCCRGYKTYYMPKIFYRGNRPLSLSETLNSPVAWGDIREKFLLESEITYRDNSAEEIIDGFQFMIEDTKNFSDSVSNSEFSNEVTQIRASFPWTSKGELAPPFLSKNDWYTK